MQIEIGYMNKRINSTKRKFTADTIKDVKLKDPTSVQSPVFYISGLSSNHMHYNYLKWNNWYYYIDDIIAETNELYRLVCTLDPLATFKDNIVNTEGFINYATNDDNIDVRLVDNRMTSDLIFYNQELTKADTFGLFDSRDDKENGTVIIRVLSMTADGTYSNSGVKTICCTYDIFEKILGQYSSDLSGDLSNIQDSFEKMFGKFIGLQGALHYIVSAIWTPYKIDFIKGTTYDGYIGPYQIDASYKDKVYYTKMWKGADSLSKTISINLPIVTGTYPWLKNSNFLQIQLTTPGGVLDLSNNNYTNSMQNTLSFEFRLIYDLDGNIQLITYDNVLDNVVGVQQWNCSVDLMGYIYEKPSSILSGASAGIKIGTAAVSGMAALGGGIMSTAGAISDVTTSEGAFSFATKMSDFGAGLKEAMNDKTARSITKTIGSGINGLNALANQNDGVRQFSSSNNITCLYMNKDFSTHKNPIINIICVLWLPRMMRDFSSETGHSVAYDTYCVRYGKPVYNYGKIETPPQSSVYYYQMNGASVELQAPASVISSVNSFINSGIYIE